MHRHARRAARGQGIDQTRVADAGFRFAVDAVDRHRAAHRHRRCADGHAAGHRHVVDLAGKQRCHLHVRAAHGGLRVADQGRHRMLAGRARGRTAHVVVRQAGAHRHARALRAQAQRHRARQAVDGGRIIGLHHDVTIRHHILAADGVANFCRDGVGDPVQNRRPAKAHIGVGAARRHRAADRHGGNLRVQARRQIIGLGEGGLHHDVARRRQRRAHRTRIHRVENLVHGKRHAGRDAASHRHRHIAGQRRNAGHVACGDTDIARGRGDRGVANLCVYRVLDRVDGHRAADCHARATRQAHRHVVDAGAFFGAHLNRFSRDRRRGNGGAHVVAHVRHPHRRADGRRCALRQRNAQCARGSDDAAGVLRRYRHRAAVRQHLRAGRRTRVVDDGGNVRARQVHADGTRAAQGLAARAGHGNAQHAVGQGMALRQRTDVQRNQAAGGDAIHRFLQADAARASRCAQLHGDAVLGIFQRAGQLVAERAALRGVDHVIALAVDQASDVRALAAVDHGVARGQARVGGERETVFARHLRLAAAGGQGRIRRRALRDAGVLGAVAARAGRRLRRLALQFHLRERNHRVGVDRDRLALRVQHLVASRIRQEILIALGAGVELGHVAQRGQRHGRAVHVLEAQRGAVHHLDHVHAVVRQAGEHAIGAHADHHLVARGQAVRLGQGQAAIGVQHRARGVVHAEALQGAAHRRAGQIDQVALAVAQLERGLIGAQVDHVIGHTHLQHVLALSQDAVGQHVVDLAVAAHRPAIHDGRAFLHARERRVQRQRVGGGVQRHARIHAVEGLQVDAGGILHAHVGKAHGAKIAHAGELQRLAAQGVFLRVRQLNNGFAIGGLAADHVVHAIVAQAGAIGQLDVGRARAQVNAVAGLPP